MEEKPKEEIPQKKTSGISNEIRAELLQQKIDLIDVARNEADRAKEEIGKRIKNITIIIGIFSFLLGGLTLFGIDALIKSKVITAVEEQVGDEYILKIKDAAKSAEKNSNRIENNLAEIDSLIGNTISLNWVDIKLEDKFQNSSSGKTPVRAALLPFGIVLLQGKAVLKNGNTKSRNLCTLPEKFHPESEHTFERQDYKVTVRKGGKIYLHGYNGGAVNLSGINFKVKEKTEKEGSK